jgi:hypothetical protein
LAGLEADASFAGAKRLMSVGRAEIVPSGDARIAMKSPKTGRRERARSDVRGRTARGDATGAAIAVSFIETQKQNGRSERIRTSGPLVPNESVLRNV